jgi:hypothetical protein
MVFDVNLNPPLLLPLFQLFAKYTPRIGFGVWTLISLLSFISGAAVLLFTVEPLLQKRKIVFLLLCVSTIQTLYFGQIYAVPFFICCCIALCLIGEKRPMGTYILVGVIIAIKPNFALWAIMLFVAGYRMAAVISTSTALGLTIVPALIYKPSVYLQWLTAYSQIPHYLFPTDVSIAGIITRLGSRQLGLALSAVVGIVLVLLVRRLRPSEMDVSGIALCAGILCSPLAWFHYSLFVAPFLVVARRWGPTETFAACLMFFPDLQDYVMHRTAHSPVDLTVATLPYFIGLSLMLFSFVKRQSFWSADKEIPASSH